MCGANLNLSAGLSMDPAVECASAREHERMRFPILNHRQFEMAVERSR